LVETYCPWELKGANAYVSIPSKLVDSTPELWLAHVPMGRP